MSGSLVLVSDTKTGVAQIVRQVRKTQGRGGVHPVYLLLPSMQVESDVRSVLGETLGVYFYQFYTLGKAVLEKAGTAVQELGDATIRRLIHQVLTELAAEGRFTTFMPVWEKPGFLETILDWLREMKGQGISPDQVAVFAQRADSEKDRQLAEIYHRYQGFLQTRHLSDPDGTLWLAAEALEGDQGLFRKPGPVLVSGFDQFSPVQMRILRQLRGRCQNLTLYLLWDEKRPEDSLALSRLRETRQLLLENIPLDVVHLPAGEGENLALEHLTKQLFEIGGPTAPANEAVRWVEAPSREGEVRCALRSVKQLLMSGVNPNKIAMLASNKNAYQPIVWAVADEYGLVVETETPLVSNPMVTSLVNLLHLNPDFPWQGTLTALRSPYVRQTWLTDDQIVLIDQLSRERPVVSGREQWEFALRPLEVVPEDGEDEDLGPLPMVATLEPDALEMLQTGLMGFFDHISPPVEASYRDYTWWVQTAILGYSPVSEEDADEPREPATTLDMLGCCREGPFPDRDEAALGHVIRVLSRLLHAAEIISAGESVAWENFRDEFMAQLDLSHIPQDLPEKAVRFSQLEGGRARVVDHLFVFGLSEGELPSPPAVDPLYAPSERESHPLPLIRYSSSSEACTWWQVISNACKTVFLLRPYIDENGAPWQASPYWDAVQACFHDTKVERHLIADHPGAEEAASLSELCVALAQAGTTEIPPELASYWDYARKATAIWRQRESFAPPGIYEGIMQDSNIKSEVAGLFDSKHPWSASRLNRYANCPYGFFAEYVLNLEATQEPVEGLDARQRGSLLHAVLEDLYRHLSIKEIAPSPGNQDEILEILERRCEVLFKVAPQRFGFRPGVLWAYEQEELRRLMRALVIWDCESSDGKTLYRPYLQEARFGIGMDGPPPLEIEAGGIHFRLRGLIVRVDKDGAGNLRVIDYKSGSQGYYRSDLEKGLATQTALYALAAERYYLGEDAKVLASEYWHIPSRQASGKLRFQGAVQADSTAQKVIEQAAWSVKQARAGVFPSAPGKPGQGRHGCSSWCDFAVLCRVTRQSITKARQGGLA